MKASSRLWTGVGVAALLWFFMFSPWTARICNFWVCMSVSALILSAIALTGNIRCGGGRVKGRPDAPADRRCLLCGLSFKAAAVQLAAGVAIAAALWGIFYLGDFLSSRWFDFARPQVDSVYAMKQGTSPALIAALLLVLIGPAEEYFWRGYVQKTLSGHSGPTRAMFLTAAIYALVHVWSLNFMLVMAALVAGGVWGLLYRIRPSLLPALVISHALWDAAVFVIFPIL